MNVTESPYRRLSSSMVHFMSLSVASVKDVDCTTLNAFDICSVGEDVCDDS